MQLRSNTPNKRLVLEQLLIRLCAEPKLLTAVWQQGQGEPGQLD
jgi:hypothetical protein